MSAINSHASDTDSSPTSAAEPTLNNDETASLQAPRQIVHDVTCASSLKEISLIQTVTSFLEENGAADIDPKTLHNLAEALSKRVDDTSPGTLQDVTMDNSYHFGYRSLCGAQGGTSPIVLGRSVRDLEEQMSALRKENFNLKLRIYFIEESMPSYKADGEGKDSLAKQLIDAKIEIEVLRKDITEKQDILKDAAQALTQMENMQKGTEAKGQATIAQLQDRVDFLEAALVKLKSQNASDARVMRAVHSLDKKPDSCIAAAAADELVTKLAAAQNENSKLLEEAKELKKKLRESESTISSCEAKIREQAIQNAELQEVIDSKDENLNKVEQKMRDQNRSLSNALQENRQMISELTLMRGDINKESKALSEALVAMRGHREQISKMQNTVAIKTLSNTRLLERVIECEGKISRQLTEVEIIKRENLFFRNKINSLEKQRDLTNGYRYELDWLRGAIGRQRARSFRCKRAETLPGQTPLPRWASGSGQIEATGYSSSSSGISVGLSRANSNTSMQTNYSGLSVLAGRREAFRDRAPARSYEQAIGIPSMPIANGCEFVNNISTPVSMQQKPNCQEELYNLKTQLADRTCELQDAKDKLQERIKIHDHACRTIQKLTQNLNNQQQVINRVQDRHQNQAVITRFRELTNEHLARQANADFARERANADFAREEANVDFATAQAMESIIFRRSMSDTEAIRVEANIFQNHDYELKVLQQEETIKHLKAEVKKKTSNLQTLVNKELWEKNREIERLTKLVPLSPTAGTSASYASHELNQSFTDVDYAKALERNKLLQRKVDVLIQHLSAERQNESVASQLRADLRKAKVDAETADKWRRECADVCGILTKRLEELAGFLNTLLKNKDVLGVLAADRRHAMRRAVDRSLDLSKSLNMTLSISGVSMADQSLVQLCNLSEILCETQDAGGELVDEANHTFNSHEDLHAQTNTIESLKAENNALKKELEKRRSTEVKKERRSLPLAHTVQQQEQSESEAWSEPDRKVSMARIGLEEHSTSLAKESSGSGQQHQQHSDTDSDAFARGHSQQLKQQQQEQRSRTQERIAQLEQLIAQRDSRILSIQCQLVEADNHLKQEHLRVLDLTQELANARQRNEALHADLVAIGEQESNDFALANKIATVQQELAALKQEHEQMAAEVQLHVLHEAELRNDMSQMQIKHELALSLAVDKEKLELGHLKGHMEELMLERLAEQRDLHEQALEREYVASSTYEELKQQLLELQRQYVESMRAIDNHQEIEQELKETLLQNELAARALKKQLDDSTLQASKAVLERTKANNDKLQLEQRVEALTTQLAELQLEHSSLQQELAEQQAYQLKQQQMQQQVQGHQQQQQRRQHQRLNSSDVSQSGYTSEEVPIAESATSSGVAIVCSQRINNSSPDLGIESDAGRVSSVELSNAQHALLKVVELDAKSDQQQQQQQQQRNDNVETEEEAFLLAADEPNGAVTTTTTTATPPAQPTHDCVKVDQENAELRRKLTRTKRALEDTYEKLRLSNKAKAQVEKDIKNQILKTQNVLKKVRSNMENEL